MGKLSSSDSAAVIEQSSVRVVADVGLATVEGIALDWLNYKLYWIESRFDHIEVIDLRAALLANNQSSNQLSHRAILIQENMQNPRAIVVDPSRGLLFWSDWDNDQPRIERATMSGQDRVVLFNISPGGAWWRLAKWPHSGHVTSDHLLHRRQVRLDTCSQLRRKNAQVINFNWLIFNQVYFFPK